MLGKINSRGQTLASSFELIFRHWPLIFEKEPIATIRLQTDAENNAHVPKWRINSILSTEVREPEQILAGDKVLFWWEYSGWIVPVTVGRPVGHVVDFHHNWMAKLASLYIFLCLDLVLQSTRTVACKLKTVPKASQKDDIFPLYFED